MSIGFGGPGIPPTTPTGIPITPCAECGRSHPVSRRHCAHCGIPSLFLAGGLCGGCRGVSS